MAESAEPRRPVNLEELEEFKAYKTQVNKTIAERDRIAKQAEQRYRQEMEAQQRRIAAIEEENEKRVISNMDEFGQAQYRAEQEGRKRKELEVRLAEIEQERSKGEFIGVLKERYGVDPTDDSHPVMALQSVTDMLHERVQSLEAENAKLKKESEARRAALDDSPDMGGGAPVHPVSELQRRYNEAMLGLHGDEADRISRQAVQDGLNLDRHSWVKQRK